MGTLKERLHLGEKDLLRMGCHPEIEKHIKIIHQEAFGERRHLHDCDL